MTTFRKASAFTIAVAVLLSAALYLTFPTSPSFTAPPTLTFIGFTNSPAQGRLAVFTVSNANDRGINFFAALPQAREGGVWPEDVVCPPPAWGTDLAANEQTEFTVVVPSDAEAWRVPVLWSSAPTTRDHVRALFRDNWHAVLEARSPPGAHVHIGLTGETNYTGEIEK